MADPVLAGLAHRVARRYIAGETIDDALAVVAANADRGHLGSVECVGESVRDEATASAQTQIFVELAARLSRPVPPTISFDLSHVGSLLSPTLALENARRIAVAARESGSSLMISAEGSDRTDLVLDLWERLNDDFPDTGVTLQARLHRTPADLRRVMERPGPVRIVKGAFGEPKEIAYPRDSEPMYDAYLNAVDALVAEGRRVNLATHDASLVERLLPRVGEGAEFEMLQGLGGDLLDTLRADGRVTREYVVFGREWWLYVLNRIAEHPGRLVAAVADLTGGDQSRQWRR
ncbi:proline dehydrogenase [Gordonia spumicola]|uniref:Proline dehydrogenase n=2 Tax=Gordonia spumicola TaxID=589161 RepID=A0A7I9VCR6_9ACTN|nr:proline dehydrogenase [Gordonia spumicola]